MGDAIAHTNNGNKIAIARQASAARFGNAGGLFVPKSSSNVGCHGCGVLDLARHLTNMDPAACGDLTGPLRLSTLA